MLNLQKVMKERINKIRQMEMSNLFKLNSLKSLNIGFSFASLPLISLLIVLSSSMTNDKCLITGNIFLILSFFALIRLPITMFLPSAIEKLWETQISAKRIDQFLELEQKKTIENETNHPMAILMENASFSWKNSFSLTNLNLQIPNGSFIGIQGATGSGKSSLLSAILGEMNFHSISYVPQCPWIFSDTIRENILLGKSMNEQHYENVIKACCLDIDFIEMGHLNDLIFIGDKRMLSGGQMTRLSLARALYHHADLYLFDDPLTNLDENVSQQIFQQCLGEQSFLQGKT